jgi:post-segregation antitoxin (ccd killing protein)
MPTYHEVGGIKYRQTTVLVREDLHAWAKREKVNVSACLNKALEEKRGKK